MMKKQESLPCLGHRSALPMRSAVTRRRFQNHAATSRRTTNSPIWLNDDQGPLP